MTPDLKTLHDRLESIAAATKEALAEFEKTDKRHLKLFCADVQYTYSIDGSEGYLVTIRKWMLHDDEIPRYVHTYLVGRGFTGIEVCCEW